MSEVQTYRTTLPSAITFRNGCRVTVEASKRGQDVWLYIGSGMLSGGTFISPEQARELADALMQAAMEAGA